MLLRSSRASFFAIASFTEYLLGPASPRRLGGFTDASRWRYSTFHFRNRSSAVCQLWQRSRPAAPHRDSGDQAWQAALLRGGRDDPRQHELTAIVNTLDRGKLFEVAIDAGGAAGAITEIAVTPALASPDGMRALDGDTLLVIEGPGRLTRVELTGATTTATPIVTGLDTPTAVVVARGSAWITEGQLGRLFTGMPPAGPFLVKRADL